MNTNNVEDFRTQLIEQNEDLQTELTVEQLTIRAYEVLDQLTDRLGETAEETECPCCARHYSVLLGQGLVAFNAVSDLRSQLSD